jgi:hypothetical protein
LLSNKLAIHICAIRRLSITDVNVVDAWLVYDNIEFAMVARNVVTRVIVDCEGTIEVSSEPLESHIRSSVLGLWVSSNLENISVPEWEQFYLVSKGAAQKWSMRVR